MNQHTPDTAAEFAIALSIYNGLAARDALHLSDVFQGFDQFMRECVRVGKVFEAWACANVNFYELTTVWPYLLEDNFLEAYEDAFGRITRTNVHELSFFNETSCPAVWAALRKKQL